jgi:hypothetical protein
MFACMWVLGTRLALSALEPGKQCESQQDNRKGERCEQ